MNLSTTTTSKSYLRSISFAKSGIIGWIGIQLHDFETGLPCWTGGKGLSSNQGWAASPLLFPRNEHRLYTFPSRAHSLLATNASDDYFLCTCYEPAFRKIHFRYLRIIYEITAEPPSEWNAVVNVEAEVWNQYQVPDSCLEKVAQTLQVARSNEIFELFASSRCSQTSLSSLRPGSLLTYSYWNVDLHDGVLCTDSCWAIHLNFQDRTSPQIHTQEFSFPALPTSAWPGLRTMVMQPIQSWRDRSGNSSILFLNLASVQLDTSVSNEIPTYLSLPAVLEERKQQVLNGSIPVFVRWDMDSSSSSSSYRLFSLAEVDSSGEWNRLIGDNHVIGSMGSSLPFSSPRTEEEEINHRLNPASYPRSGEWSIEVFGKGLVSLDLSPFCPWFHLSPSTSFPSSQTAIEITSGDVVMKGDARLLGDSEEKMVIAPTHEETPMQVGYHRELTIQGNEVCVHPNSVLYATQIRGYVPSSGGKETVTISGNAERPLRVVLGSGEMDEVEIGTMVTKTNVSEIIQAKQLSIQGTTTQLQEDGSVVIGGDLEVTGTSIKLGSATSVVTIEAPQTSFHTSNSTYHGSYVDNGLWIQW
jgi:hypothetical protein